MDSHSADDAVLWHHLPNRYGFGGLFSSPSCWASLTGLKDSTESMARPGTSLRDGDCSSGIFLGTLA
jgi:hypothetical protein